MAEIEKLEQCDHENFATNLRFVNTVDERCGESLDAFGTLLDEVGTAFGNMAGISGHDKAVGEWADSVPLPSDLAVEMLDKAILLGASSTVDETSTAKDHLVRGIAKWARLRLLQRLKRDFSLGVIDLLRNHAVPAMGYLRVQSESAALLRLFEAKPALGARWWNAITLDEGAAFHRANNSGIRTIIKDAGLDLYYQMGSAMAMHSRSAGVVHGILYGGEPPESEDTVTIKMTYQDLDSAKQVFVHFTNYLMAHSTIARLLPSCVPEVSGAVFEQSLPDFVALVDGVVTTAQRVLSQE